MAIKTYDSERCNAKIHECDECREWIYAERRGFTKIMHRRFCESREQPVVTTGSKQVSSAKAINASAKAGTLNRDYSEAEIRRAVTGGQISVSDAMNQDM